MLTRLLAAGLLSVPVLALATPDAKLPVPPTGWDVLKDVPHGELKKNVSYKTTAYGNQVYSIHFPPGYSTEKKYPVLYLHHGITDDQLTWTNQTKGRAHHILDNLYAEKKAVPMVVVMVDGAMGDNGDFNAFGKFGDVLIKDLIPHIEATYSVHTDPLQRAIGGLSMGGGQSLNFGFGNYKMFNWIGAFASAPNTTPANQTIKDPADVNRHVKFTFISCGSTDDLKANSENYHKFLDANNIGPHMFQWEPNQAHTWTAFNRSLYNYVQRIFTAPPLTGITLAGKGLNGRAPQTTLVFQSGRLVVQRKDGGGTGAQGRFLLDGRSFPFHGVASHIDSPRKP